MGFAPGHRKRVGRLLGKIRYSEGRRNAVLDLIGKATPGLFRPALQIDPVDARLLIEALSGRWVFENERRDQRNIWFHVANAFSLLVSSIEPVSNDDKVKVLSPLDDLR